MMWAPWYFFLWCVTWILYKLGDWAYSSLECFDATETWVQFWYVIYDRLMKASLFLQEKAGGEGNSWPWGKPMEMS